jgi:SAM-dependent methyltransferase
MAGKTPGFTHRDKFSGYMGPVIEALGDGRGRRALDLPAGAGHLSDALRRSGFEVVSADFNRDRPDYVLADMNARLPFADGEFEVVACLEGIEHVLRPFDLVGELARVCRPGGTVIISTPNVMGFYSRLQFLFTGTFFQFAPVVAPEVVFGEQRDRGHISPTTLGQLEYAAHCHGLHLVDVRTDKIKRKAFVPLFLLCETIGRPWKARLFSRRATLCSEARRAMLLNRYNSRPVALGRTLIGVFTKPAE